MPQSPSVPEAPRVATLQAWGRARLSGADARRESELLLGHALQRDRAWLFAHADEPIAPAECAGFAALIARRASGTPIAQLLGRWGFWTLDLRVTEATLIPRPETELLVELALERMPRSQPLRIADLGTGTGAIALALARERPQAFVVATDASTAALEVARANARDNEVANVEFRAGDWYQALGRERFALIASNPPYIAAGDPHLVEGDLRYEPRTALESGGDGLDAIRRLAAGAHEHLDATGWLLLEHGCDQGAAVSALMRAAGFDEVATHPDLEQRDRVTLGRFAG
jgi:release factor glutamine methyltransferase